MIDINSMNNFIKDVLDKDGKYIDKNYPCSSPFGKCNDCCDYVQVFKKGIYLYMYIINNSYEK